MYAYYNEIDKYAADWLRNLILEGLIAPGDVDTRSIVDVHHKDLLEYKQCHFFAGIGGWSYGLRLAGWSDDRPVWTGSCPCQPFSAAGRRLGSADDRHLWPVFARLIKECSPTVVFGEQVASHDGRKWLSTVRFDLEQMGYGVGAADLCAAGVGSPQVRQRLYWVADSSSERLSRFISERDCVRSKSRETSAERSHSGIPTWLYNCSDPSTIIQNHGVRRPVGAVHAFGNAIVPQLASRFIQAFVST